MSSQPRFRGRFDSELTDEDALDAVAVVAPHARPARPAMVSMRVFNAARGGAGRADCPTAEPLHHRFNPPASQPVTWAALVAFALLPTAERARPVNRLRRRKQARDFDDANIVYGLRLVALRLDRDSFARHEYRAVRDCLVAEDRRRNGHEALLDAVMPTLAQIEQRTDHRWPAALALAGLRSPIEVRDDPAGVPVDEDAWPRPRSLTIAEGLAYFAAVNQRWPGYRTLRLFLAACGAAVGDLTDSLARHRRE